MVSAASVVLNQLCNDTYGNLSWCLGVDWKADRALHLFKRFRRNTPLDQLLVYRLSLPATADHADVARLGF
jgi:hypothetical protein